MFSVTFIVIGTPIGKQRPRFRRVGNFVQTYTAAKTKTYEQEIGDVAKKAMGSTEPLETPLTVCVYIRVPIPASYSKKRTQACLDGSEKPIKKPDADNVAKAALDAMNGIVYKDDSQIVNLHIRKTYAITGAIEVLVSEDLE